MPFEDPENAEVTVDTTAVSVEEAAEAVLAAARQLGYLKA